MEETTQKNGALWFLGAQGLFLVMIFVALTVYPGSPTIAVTLIGIIVAGMIYCGWRGFTALWKK